MVSGLSELYQEIIMDHRRNPRNAGELEGANRSAEGYNPFCGDRVVVYLKVEDDVVTDIGFTGDGCAISIASTSLMTESARGKTLAEAEKLFDAFHAMLLGTDGADIDYDELGDLEALAGVRQFPVRVKCASLPWHTLKAALVGQQQAVTTE